MLATPRWLDDVAEHDFEAAFEYLSLRLSMPEADVIVGRLRNAELTSRRVNDILRACGYTSLTLEDPGVQREEDKVSDKKRLSPILVVSFDFGGEIADGFHRACYAYNVNPYMEVPLRMANWNGDRHPGDATR
jgi:hypothetical protein